MSGLVLLLAADTDIQTAFGYYEEVQEGRGTVLLVGLESAFTQLRSFLGAALVFTGTTGDCSCEVFLTASITRSKPGASS